MPRPRLRGREGGLQDLWESVRRRPEDSRAWYALGVAALEAGDTGHARFAFTQSAHLSPQNVDQVTSAADLLMKAGCHTEAEQILMRVLECAPNSKAALVRLAELLMDTGREEQAANELATALASQPRDIELHLMAATARERQGALALAAQHLSAALALDGNHLEANRRLGAVLTRLGDTGGAVRCWRRIVTRTGGQDIEALTGLGISLSSHGRHTEALQILKEVVRRQPRSASALGDLGMALANAGRPGEAVAAFKQALEIDPRSAQAYCGLGIAYQRQGRWPEAAQAFRATEQLAPENAVGSVNLALALQELGDLGGARRALLRAAAREPDDPEIQRLLEEISTTAHDEQPSRGSQITPVAPPAPGFGASIAGDLKSFQLFDVLEFLRLQRKTGSLVVSSRQGAGIVRLIQGAVTSASAPRVKRLGQVLLENRVISQQHLDRALSRQQEDPQHGDETLGAVLLRERLIDQDRLTTAIRRQVLAALEDMLSWHEGAFSFHPSAEGSPPLISFDLQDVMLKLLRMADERKAGRPLRPD